MADTTPSAEGETLREFVLRNRGLPKAQALDQVFEMPKVRAWVGSDTARRERLTREFERLWAEVAVGESPARLAPRPQPHMGPAHQHADERVVREAARPPKVVRSRREKFICSACGSYDIFSESDGHAVHVRCRQCKTEFPDLLALVPVVEVGPFELFFGHGREAAVKIGAITLVWAAVILLMRLLVW